ncbi:MAG: Clp protease N-terminal domain-containing protein [Planctomycetota bacterium]|jgi:ATP-dependent Clp protease ATP-binding subunit ClpC
MFERFTDNARSVMATANQQAQQFGHDRIGTEHIFLGLLKQDAGTGVKILKDHGVDTEKMLLEIEQILKVKDEAKLAAEGNLPATASAVQVVQYAIEEARKLNHDHIGTEHLLLGLLRETGGIAAQVLANLGVKLEDVRESLS